MKPLHTKEKPPSWNLIYLANARLPTEKANGIQIVNMCSAFSKLGYSVVLAIPNRQESRSSSKIFSFYSIDPSFTIKKIWCINPHVWKIPILSSEALIHPILNTSFCLSALFTYARTHSLIYTRSKLAGFLLSLTGSKVVFEAHSSSRYPILYKLICSRFHSIITISQSLTHNWSRLHQRVHLAPDGVSDLFFQSIPKSKARARLNLKPRVPIAVYSGNLFAWKGIDTIIQAATLTPQVQFHLIGGSPHTHPDRQSLPSNVVHHPPLPQQQLLPWLKAADVLLIANSAKFTHSSQDTSPLKLFEYMATGVPILASRVPAITEILDSNSATFFTPDHPQDLHRQLSALLSSYKESLRRASRARNLAKSYTWLNRAQNITDFILNQ